MTIWKFVFAVADSAVIEMPKDSIVLSVQAQGADLNISIWALVDVIAPKESRIFKVFGTGHPLPDNPGKYLGTVQFMLGQLVFHVFEVMR